jgi:uncharacterized membrane protein
MAPVRVCSILTLVSLVAYYILRGLATQCAGPQCDNYILPSLALPLLVLIFAVVTGLLAIVTAWRAGRATRNVVIARRYQVWVVILGVCALLGFLGPLVSLLVLRDSPDSFVAVATALILLAALSALIFSFLADPTPQGA